MTHRNTRLQAATATSPDVTRVLHAIAALILVLVLITVQTGAGIGIA